MTGKRNVEVFTTGCAACEETAEFVRRTACPSCNVVVLDMKTIDVARLHQGAQHSRDPGCRNR
jgi:hypothetical protein